MESVLTQSIEQALDRPELSLSARVKCLRRLYRTCGSHKLLPKNLKVSVSYDRNEYPLFRGGYADVWKGEHRGQDVAVKVIRTYSRSELQKITGVSHRFFSPPRLTTDDGPRRGFARRLWCGSPCNIPMFCRW